MKDEKDYTQRLKFVEQVLFNDWDPIGVNDAGIDAFDEYDNYAPKIVTMWFEGALNEDALVEYLLEMETKNMGLPGNEELARHVAEKLVSNLS